VYAKPAASRSKFDKAVMKTDEKVNICYTLFSGQYLRILPVPGIADSTKWHTPAEAPGLATTPSDSAFLTNVVPGYFEAVQKAKQTGNYKAANLLLGNIAHYQRTYAGYELPGNFKIKTEIAYVKANLFKKLFPFYFTLGIVYLFYLLSLVVIGRQAPGRMRKTFYIIVLLAFILHTLGIAARWYISGHAPMSNGYESMIFISWVTLLAGFLFSKKSDFTLTATVILAGLTLLVANLSFMDPGITNLVPVLQSYWLTIHVSVITASYGFLGLGFLLGLINLLLIVLRTGKNHARVSETFNNLTTINHRTLILGLYLLTIGTFLGAVWANESWGRYWGWDPKETWALISVLVYTLVTHARMIPGMKGDFTFNVLSVFSFGSILMTYFGVNYYLSGLHSYAGGDPVPIPSFVYFSLATLIILTLISSVKFSKHYSRALKQ
jgi:cytochrome c-type biogenesis protein CcsB